MVTQKISEWISTFDISKAILLAIVAILGSWYDLRSKVELSAKDIATNRVELSREIEAVKQESILRWQGQDKTDETQNRAIRDIHDEVKDGFKELKQVVRDNSPSARR